MSETLVPCICRLVIKRDPRTFASSSRLHVNRECPRHGAPKPIAPKETK